MDNKIVIVANGKFFLMLIIWVLFNFGMAGSAYIFAISFLNHKLALMTVAMTVFASGIASYFMISPFGTFWYYNKISNQDIEAFFRGRK